MVYDLKISESGMCKIQVHMTSIRQMRVPRYNISKLNNNFKEVPLFAILTRNISSNFSLEFFSICEYNS